MEKIAVIIYGAPGSGKGTQAELLESKYDLIHFDTGHLIERLVREKGWRKDPIVRRERALFDAGKLCTTEWVLGRIKETVKNIAAAGWSIAFSGSPRTHFEAFGKGKEKGLVPLIEKLYGKKNMHIIELDVASESSIHRNSKRFVCSVCGLPVLGDSEQDHCAFCAGPLRKRSLDNPEVIKVRLEEYRERTKPILDELGKRGFKVKQINGETPPFKVSEEIIKSIHLFS